MTNQPPWASFCMTTRRRPDLLRQTLRSIQSQRFADFEVIVSDNDPEGSAKPVIEGLNDPRIRHNQNETDLGMNASFNRSLALARGEFVVMITDDDPVYPDHLEVLRDLAAKHPGYGAYYGGCNMMHVSPELARFTLARVGMNSCLAKRPLNEIRSFSAEQFPHAFFGGEVDMYLLWSVGMIRRLIAQAIGLADYGTPFLGDFCYTVSACSQAGCVVINYPLGHQTVHQQNFGRKECADLCRALTGFYGEMEKRFSTRPDWPALKPKVESFLGHWMVMHSLFLRQYFQYYRQDTADFKQALRALFAVPFMKRYRLYYFLGAAFFKSRKLQESAIRFVLHRMQKPVSPVS
jgi:glycosyltransferase involved in cell wall biosynthesis